MDIKQAVETALDAIPDGGITYGEWYSALVEAGVPRLDMVVPTVRDRADVDIRLKVVDGANTLFVERVEVE